MTNEKKKPLIRPRRLDRTRPFNRVFSTSGSVVLLQDGLSFMPSGKQVGIVDDFPPDDVNISNQIKLRSKDDENKAIPYEEMHWLELKALVESFGGVYKDKESAINYLQDM